MDMRLRRTSLLSSRVIKLHLFLLFEWPSAPVGFSGELPGSDYLQEQLNEMACPMDAVIHLQNSICTNIAFTHTYQHHPF